MKFFLDTANIDALIRCKQTGLIEGITTNPSHLTHESGDSTALIKELAKIMFPHDVSVEITQSEPALVYEQACLLSDVAPNIVVKIPCHQNFVSSIDSLIRRGIPLNITLIFNTIQGLAMANLGARYISPFIGRLEDSGGDGNQLIQDLSNLLNRYSYTTKIIAASIRSISHLQQAALAGSHIATIPVHLFDQMLDHPLTSQGMLRFAQDWETLGNSTFPSR